MRLRWTLRLERWDDDGDAAIAEVVEDRSVS
jgi:hypothetical protein